MDKNGNKNWLINASTISLPPLLKKGDKFFTNKLKFKPKAGKKLANNFGRKHTSLYLCTPKLKNGKAVIAKDL